MARPRSNAKGDRAKTAVASKRKGKSEVVKTGAPEKKPVEAGPADPVFGEVLQLIQSARQRAYQSVNSELIVLYWQVGKYISRKLTTSEWGDGVVDELARFLARTQPELRGFTRPNLFRMRSFYEAYRNDPIVSALLTQLPWTHHLLILGHAKQPEEREYYIRLAVHEKWPSRELERQLKAGRFERKVLSPVKVSAALRQIHPEALNLFKDSYTREFLGLTDEHSEADLHTDLLQNLGRFLTELG